VDNSNKTHLVYAVGVGLLLSDMIPTPADALYFYKERVNKEKLTKGEITPKQFWTRDAIGYYGYNALWWSLVLGATVMFGKDYKQKKNIMIGLVAGGLVVGVIAKNIKKDEEFYANKI
jgi:uncharacterized membrane protein YkvI